MTKTDTKHITVASVSGVALATPSRVPTSGADGTQEKIYVRPSWRALMHLLPQLDGEFPVVNLQQEMDGSLRVDFGEHLNIEVSDTGVSIRWRDEAAPLTAKSLGPLACIFAAISAAEADGATVCIGNV